MVARVEVSLIAELGEPEFVDEMVDLFAELTSEQVRELRSALDQGDATAVLRAAHKWKGACLAMYATTLADVADALENQGRAGQLDSAREAFNTLEPLVADTLSQMRNRPGPSDA